eukprot:TRINITY_DN8907_c1_g7_i1.p1 TRINITY_DN8907_c1_g7~~TRINITY_DN8907_c1_g7_i1.p1  ORF type:complete len:1190 (+),score=241.99 TRINITY_DN8907_c1_g7_i1:219-3788(+)
MASGLGSSAGRQELMADDDAQDGCEEEESFFYGLEPPDRPCSAPPNLDPIGLGLFAFGPYGALLPDPFQHSSDQPDRPRSAPPDQLEDDRPFGELGGEGAGDLPIDGDIAGRGRGEVFGRGLRLGVIGPGRGLGARASRLDPRGRGIFPYQSKLSTRLPTSPPLQEEGYAEPDDEDDDADDGLIPSRVRTPSLSRGDSSREHGVGYFGLQPPLMGLGKAGSGEGPLSSHFTPSPCPHTPPPPGFGSPVTHGPLGGFGGLGIGADDCPQLLHPGAVRAFDPIDRPISAPPLLDPGAALLALQASYPGNQTPDIRCDESYADFYQLYQDKNMNLPPPLEPSSELVRARIRSDFDASAAGAEREPGMGIAGLAPATGFPDQPCAAAVYHHSLGTHLPRSPSPPWENSAAGGHASAAVAAQHVAAAQATMHAAAAAAAAHAAAGQPQLGLPLGATGAAACGGACGCGPCGACGGCCDAARLSAANAAVAAAAAGGYQAAAATLAAAIRNTPLVPGAPFSTAAPGAFGEAIGTPPPFAWQQFVAVGNAAAAAAAAAASSGPLAGPMGPASIGAAAGAGAGVGGCGQVGAEVGGSAGSRSTAAIGSSTGMQPLAAGMVPGSLSTLPPGGGSGFGQGEGLSTSSAKGRRGARGGGEAASKRPDGGSASNGLAVPAGSIGATGGGSLNGGSSAAFGDSSIGGYDGGGGGSGSTGGGRPTRGFKTSHLEEIFASNTFVHNVHAIAKDQAGCRMLQHKLDEGNAEVASAIFAEVLNHCVDLMMDPFGNYLVQKLMDMCNAKQLELILDKVCGSLVRIALNMHGARAAQKLIDAVASSPRNVHRLVAALRPSVVALTKDPNGNHVVQRCLESLPVDAHGFIFQAVAGSIFEVASHRHGCRIVQRCIDASTGTDRQYMTGSICANALTLVQDPFGNYVVQYVLGLGEAQATSMIIQSMLGHLNVLSRQKFSSNVVEKCLQSCSAEDKEKLIRELCDSRGLGEILRDHYGNYVVQSALGSAHEPLLSMLLGAVKPLLPSLRASGQGRRIAQKLEKKYPVLRSGGGGGNNGGGGCGAGGGNSEALSLGTVAYPHGGYVAMAPMSRAGALPAAGQGQQQQAVSLGYFDNQGGSSMPPGSATHLDRPFTPPPLDKPPLGAVTGGIRRGGAAGEAMDGGGAPRDGGGGGAGRSRRGRRKAQPGAPA